MTDRTGDRGPMGEASLRVGGDRAVVIDHYWTDLGLEIRPGSDDPVYVYDDDDMHFVGLAPIELPIGRYVVSATPLHPRSRT